MQAAAGAALSGSEPQRPSAPPAGHSRWAVFGTLALVLAAGYITDQVTKYYAEHRLTLGEDRPLLGPVLKLHLTYNPGAAFSLGTGATWVLTLIACAVVLFTVWSARRLRSLGWAWALGLLLAGALGNLTDRWLRAPGPGRGHVVDFLRLPHWPIFNIADVCIVSAACVISLLALRGTPLGGTEPGENDPAAPSREAADA